MQPLLADYSSIWPLYLLLFGWPALNWLAAFVALIVTLKKRRSPAWLVLPAIPIGSAAFFAIGFLRDREPPDIWLIAGFFLPALFGLASVMPIARRAFARAPQRDAPSA